MYGCVFHHIYVTMFFRNLFLLTEGGTENESGCNYIISYRDSSGYHHCSIIFLRQESTEKAGRTAGAVRCQQADRIHADHR